MDQSSNTNTPQSTDESRRDFVKKVAYVTPLILSFSVKPALAQTGSGPGTQCPPGSVPAGGGFCVAPNPGGGGFT